MPAPVTLDGHSLAIEDVVSVARHGASVAVAAHSLAAVNGSRRVVEAAIARGDTMYGVTTGFGRLAHVRIRPEQARELHRNLIRSHASAVGDPLPVRSEEHTSELQSPCNLVCRLLLEKKKIKMRRRAVSRR